MATPTDVIVEKWDALPDELKPYFKKIIPRPPKPKPGEEGEEEPEDGEPGEGEGEPGEEGDGKPGEEGEPEGGEDGEGEPGEGEEGEGEGGEEPRSVDEAMDELKKGEQKADKLNEKKDKLQEKKDELADELSKETDPGKSKEIKDKMDDLDNQTGDIDDELSDIEQKNDELTDEIADAMADAIDKEMDDIDDVDDFDNAKKKDASDLMDEQLENAEAGAGEADNADIQKITTEKPKFVADETCRAVQRKLEKQLKTLISDFKQKLKASKRGRLNIRAVIRARAKEVSAGVGSAGASTWKLEKIYKRRTENILKKVRLGVVIILDRSSSMTQYTDSAGQLITARGSFSPDFEQSKIVMAVNSVWAMTKALESTKSKVAIISFGNSGGVYTAPDVVEPREVPDMAIEKDFYEKEGLWSYDAPGGTNVLEPITQAVKMLKKLKKKERIENLFLILVSDGEWSQTEEVAELCQKINVKKEIQTIHVGIQYDAGEQPNNKFQHILVVQELKQLSASLAKIIKKLQTKVLMTALKSGMM